VTTYVPWNLHEPTPGQYDFSGRLDIVRFIEAAQQEGFLVIVRPPPYICAGSYPTQRFSSELCF
jgi:beta-galactosidase